MKFLEGLSDHVFASAQLIAQLHRDNVRTQFPPGILAEILWLNADELSQLYGDAMTARDAVVHVRHANPNHILPTILSEGNDRG
ncbi:hypothetical protein [Streptomyces lavendulae]|uniref:hypothetical protein n=1 Tax=Streptomyces lavendulae TaxID=1914 RepID=UPI00382A5960